MLKSGSQKGNVFLVILLLVAILGGIGYYFYSQGSFNNASMAQLISKIKNSGLSTSKDGEIPVFETITLGETNISDSKTELVFADANKLYKMKLDGSVPTLINSFTYNIKSVTLLNNAQILVDTGYTKYKNSGSDTNTKSLGWVPVSSVEEDYLIDESINTKGKINQTEIDKLYGISGFYTSAEKVYTKSGEFPEIFSDKLDGNPPVRIGTITQNNVNGKKMGVSGRDFIPSFDGSYLLNKDYGKGYEPMFVVSRDGSKTYDINIESGSNSIIWVNNDTLFANKDGKALKIVLNNDGTFAESPLNGDLQNFDNFSQAELSPNKKYLFLSFRMGPVSIYDSSKNVLMPVEKEKSSAHPWFSFIGWNEKGNKVLYRSDINAGSSDSVTEIKIYDIATNKSYVLARFSNTTTDENMTSDKPKANISNFAIR
jgi:hypothetical protein